METEQEVWARFEYLENSLDLGEWQVSGVYVWKIVRNQMYDLFLRELGLYKIFNEGRFGPLKLLKKLFRLFLYLFLANPYFPRSSKPKPISISSEREKIIEQLPVDTISDRYFLRSQLSKTNVLFTSKGSIEHLRNGQKANSIPLLLGRFLALFQKITFSAEDKSKILGITEYLVASASLSGQKDDETYEVSKKVKSLTKQMRKEIAVFIGTKAAYTLLFRRLKPSRLYIVSSYSWHSIIAAAKELSIEVCEFQHGVVSSGSVGYDFRYWREVPYFPDVFFAWGPDWFSQVHFPTACQRLIVGPNSSQLRFKELKGMQKNLRRLLVLTQGKRTDDLITFVRKFSDLRPEWQVFIKLHPREEGSTKRSRIKTQDSSFLNLQVHEGDLYSALQKADVVLGQSSTSMFEAALSGSRVVMVKGKHRAPVDIADICGVSVVQTPDELAREIDSLRYANTHGLFAEKKIDFGYFC